MEMERCHFWLARFRDQSQIDDYFQEPDVYSEREPISKFAADQGKRFYDHDWVFVEFDEGGDLNTILRTIGAPKGTWEALLEAAKVKRFTANAVVVAAESEFTEPQKLLQLDRTVRAGIG
jgi:hypothetical protein